MSESLPSGKLLHSLFASLLSLTLSNKIQSKKCCREEFNDRYQIHCMDKICVKLGAFGEFATAVLQTLHGKRCFHHMIIFLNHVNETNSA